MEMLSKLNVIENVAKFYVLCGVFSDSPLWLSFHCYVHRVTFTLGTLNDNPIVKS
jgi:hypothetical protein